MDITIDNLVVSKLSEFDINKVKNCASDVKTRSGSGRNQVFLARIRIWAEPRFFFAIDSGSTCRKNRAFFARIWIWVEPSFFCSDPDLGEIEIFLLGSGSGRNRGLFARIWYCTSEYLVRNKFFIYF